MLTHMLKGQFWLYEVRDVRGPDSKGPGLLKDPSTDQIDTFELQILNIWLSKNMHSQKTYFQPV